MVWAACAYGQPFANISSVKPAVCVQRLGSPFWIFKVALKDVWSLHAHLNGRPESDWDSIKQRVWNERETDRERERKIWYNLPLPLPSRQSSSSQQHLPVWWGYMAVVPRRDLFNKQKNNNKTRIVFKKAKKKKNLLFSSHNVQL